jgi:hypothetical protein
MSDVGMVSCVNYHIFCDEHRLNDEEFSEEELEETGYGSEAVPTSACPICQFETYSQSDMSKYLEELTSISRATVFEEIKKVNKRRKKLYDEEYINYALKELGKTDLDVLKEIKEKYQTYENFRWRNKK